MTRKTVLASATVFVFLLAAILLATAQSVTADQNQTAFSNHNGECAIPETGPWPPCATGEGNRPPSSEDCVIPASGPWPPCATGGEGGGSQPATPAGPPTPTPVPTATPIPRQPIVVGNNLRFYYAFDEEQGDVLINSAGQETASFNENVQRIQGPRNGALRVNGQGKITIPNVQNINIGQEDFTVAMWVKVSQQFGVQRIFDKRSHSPVLQGFHMFTWDGAIGFQLADGNGNVPKCKFDPDTEQCTNYVTNYYIADDQWHFVVVTVDRDETNGLTFWVDTKFAGQFDPTGRRGSLHNPNSPVPLIIDAWEQAVEVDEFYLYGRVLSNEEIGELYRNR